VEAPLEASHLPGTKVNEMLHALNYISFTRLGESIYTIPVKLRQERVELDCLTNIIATYTLFVKKIDFERQNAFISWFVVGNVRQI
jgi:hypothetical protein